MSRFTFRGSRREADDMAIRGRLSAEVKLEATARNVKARPGGQAALENSQSRGVENSELSQDEGLTEVNSRLQDVTMADDVSRIPTFTALPSKELMKRACRN